MLKYEKRGNVAKKIVITSGKGGVGKTTVTANIGSQISSMGYRVLLCDVDFGLNNLDVVLGIESCVVYDVKDVLDGRCRSRQALIQHPRFKNLYVLPSDKSGTGNINGQNLKLIIDGLSSVFDYVLLDCPAGIDIGFHRAVSCADSAIVVTTPALSSLRDADKVISILDSYRLEKVSLIVNKVRGDLVAERKMMFPKDVEDILKTHLIGVIPEDDDILLNRGGVNFKSTAGKAYKIIANNIISGTSVIFDAISKYNGFFGSIRRGLKKAL